MRQGYTDVLIRICPLLRRSGNKSEIFAFPRAKRISLVPQERISVPARGLESRRCDAKPRKFRLGYAPRSVAALMCHRHIIHYRSPSSPLMQSRTKNKEESLCDSSLFLVRARGHEILATLLALRGARCTKRSTVGSLLASCRDSA